MAQTYRQLKKIWYKKLKNSGFEDIETKDGQLKGGSNSWRYTSAFAVRYSHESRQEYYYMANQFLNTHKFDSELHKSIWSYHAEGLGAYAITDILKKAGIGKFYKKSKKRRSFSRPTVSLILKKYKTLMKKEYGLE